MWVILLLYISLLPTCVSLLSVFQQRNEKLEKELNKCNKNMYETKQSVKDGKKEVVELEAVVKQLQEIKDGEFFIFYNWPKLFKKKKKKKKKNMP
jgi:hypothetical protein